MPKNRDPYIEDHAPISVSLNVAVELIRSETDYRSSTYPAHTLKKY